MGCHVTPPSKFFQNSATGPLSGFFPPSAPPRVASFAPAHVALRAAFGRLPGQRPLARVPVSSPLRAPVRVLLPARRRCAPEFWVRSAIRPYPGFPFAGIRVIRGHLPSFAVCAASSPVAEAGTAFDGVRLVARSVSGEVDGLLTEQSSIRVNAHGRSVVGEGNMVP